MSDQPQSSQLVSWQTCFWTIVAIASNTMLQNCGSVLTLPAEARTALRSSPPVSFADSLSIILQMIWLLCHKVCSLSNVPGTQACSLCYFVSFAIIELLDYFAGNEWSQPGSDLVSEFYEVYDYVAKILAILACGCQVLVWTNLCGQLVSTDLLYTVKEKSVSEKWDRTRTEKVLETGTLFWIVASLVYLVLFPLGYYSRIIVATVVLNFMAWSLGHVPYLLVEPMFCCFQESAPPRGQHIQRFCSLQ